jgi:tetratricopeptide (TPR) repeat protein
VSKKRNARRRAKSEPPRVAEPARAPAAERARGPLGTWLAIGAAVLLLALAAYFTVAGRKSETAAPATPTASVAERPNAPRVPAPDYVGGAACASCHAKEHEAWKGSHHDRAMAGVSDATVLGNFANARFAHAGVASTFFKRDGKFFVNTEGPDGKLADFEIKYTFGFTPLQQYLVEFPGGRLQALGIAWDARPKSQGGQRWFHLYPDRKLEPGDPLHWTGIDQTWNYQCADCHSTNLRKNYDEKTNTYATKWTDINVTCEACHGPGSNHVAWAKKDGDWKRYDGAGKGLTIALDERRGASWAIDPQTGNAARSKPRESSREIEACARCHARRGQFTDAWQAGDRFADGYRASLIEAGLYYDDGQIRDEVYNYASLLESRMHAKGVTCSDCHDPHTQKLRAPGNAVCGPCHSPAKYDAASHHHHAQGSKGAECAACHMPTTTYMVVDPRHDHSFRIPRPDRTVSLGIPNACNKCHVDRKPEWAADAVKKWYPQPKPGFQSFAEAFAVADRGAPGAQSGLVKVAEDRQQSAIARASAIRRLGRYLSPATLPTVGAALDDPDGLVRAAAASALSGADTGTRVKLLPRLLGDPIREVRMEAARSLAGEPESGLSPADRAKLANALDEYVAAERFVADRPEGRANLGNLNASQGNYEDAIAAYRDALALDPTYVQAALNLADLYRSRGLEEEADKTIREALKRDPRSAPAHFALGLSLTRQKRTGDALKELAEAVKIAPDNARFAYVYAVALNDAGQKQQAIRELEGALKRQPYDRDLLVGLALLLRDGGNRTAALRYAERLAELEPDNPQIVRFVRELGGAQR